MAPPLAFGQGHANERNIACSITTTAALADRGMAILAMIGPHGQDARASALGMVKV